MTLEQLRALFGPTQRARTLERLFKDGVAQGFSEAEVRAAVLAHCGTINQYGRVRPPTGPLGEPTDFGRKVYARMLEQVTWEADTMQWASSKQRKATMAPVQRSLEALLSWRLLDYPPPEDR